MIGDGRQEDAKICTASTIAEHPHAGVVKDAYGPAAQREATQVQGLLRNSDSPEAAYNSVASFLNEKGNNRTVTLDLVNSLNKLDAGLLPDLSVVYEQHELQSHNDGLNKPNEKWDSTMAAAVEKADLRGHERADWLGPLNNLFGSRDITIDDVNSKLQDMHSDGQSVAIHCAEAEKTAHTKRALDETVAYASNDPSRQKSDNTIKFEGLSAMIKQRNQDDPGQAAADILADDETSTLRSNHGALIHLSAIQRNALENVKTDYEVRAGLYPNLYQLDVREHNRDPYARWADNQVPDTAVVPTNPGLFFKGIADWFQND